MTTITDGTTTVTPLTVDGYGSTRNTQNLIHPILGSGTADVTLQPALARSGTLTLIAATLADAHALETIHSGTAVLTLADTEYPALDMNYVAFGSIDLELDDETRNAWTVTVGYQEVNV